MVLMAEVDVEMYTPPFRATRDGYMMVQKKGLTIVTPVTIDMVRKHMAAKLEKWLKEKPRWMMQEEAFRNGLRHTKVQLMVGDDHRYEKKIMKHKVCPICGSSTDIGVD